MSNYTYLNRSAGGSSRGRSAQEYADTINSVYPVKSVRLYKRTIEVIRGSRLKGDYSVRGKKRAIEELSVSARRRMAFILTNTDVRFRSMITLTYGVNYPRSGKSVKRDLNYILTSVRRLTNRSSYFWFLEFQKRGAPHFHLLLSCVRPDDDTVIDLAGRWSKRVSFGAYYSVLSTGEVNNDRQNCYKFNAHATFWQNELVEDGLVRYGVKYALKPYQKEVPANYADVGRFYGYSRDVKDRISVLGEMKIDELHLRDLLSRMGSTAVSLSVLPRYLW